jgi:mannosyltransferase OCH1-like enzyme
MIPKTLFSVWFQGEENATSKVKEVFAANRALAESCGWTFTVYDEEDLKCAAHAAGFYEKFASYERLHQKVDFGRMCVLATLGGVSVDADQKFVKPPSGLPHLDSDVPVFSEIACEDSKMCHYLWSVGADTNVNNALIMSPRGSREMMSIVEKVAARRSVRTGSGFVDVQMTTGPIVISHIVSRMKKEGRAKTMPAGIVEPCSLDSAVLLDLLSGTTGGGRCKAREESIAVHKYESSWATDFVHGSSAMCALAILAAIIASRRRGRS